MAFEQIVIYSIALFVLVFGSITDLKKREVPDFLNYGLLVTGFFVNIVFSLVYSEWSYIINSVFGFSVFFVLAVVMFYTGQWGGGDSKMLMGLGALVGLEFILTDQFLIGFFVNSLFVGAVYGLLYSIFLAYRNRKKFVKEYNKFSRKKFVNFSRIVIFSAAVIALIFSVIIEETITKVTLAILGVVLVVIFYLWMFVKIVEKTCMYKRVLPKDLTEGDWIAKDVKVDGKVITGPKDLGIEKKQINKLIRFYKEKKVNRILIKEGIPFVPSFLLAFIITIVFGNLVMLIF